MSRNLSGILNSLNTTRFKRSFRGQPSKSGLDMSFEFPVKSFVTAVLKKERTVLYKVGWQAWRRYQRMVGKSPPKMLTKRMSITKRYREEIERGNRHKYPYKRIGTLQKYSHFAVDMDRGDVTAGPMFFRPKSPPQTPKTVPQLLNEGGEARVMAPKLKKVTISDRRQGRGRRKTKKYFWQRDGVEWVDANYRRLNWTFDLRDYGIGRMRDLLARTRL